MTRRLAAAILFLFIAVRALAVEVVVSHAVFFQSAEGKLSPVVEVYWQINPHTVHFTTTPEKMIISRLKTDIVFYGAAGVLKEEHFIEQTPPRANINELMAHSIIDLRRYRIDGGQQVTMKFTVTDLADSLHPFRYADSFMVPAPAPAAFYSDVQLLDTIIASPAATVFNKNGRQQVPACTNFIGGGKNTLHYYAELYSSDHVPASEYPLIQKVAITKKVNGGVWGGLSKTDTIVPDPVHIVSGSFPIAAMPSGNYYVSITLENSTHQAISSSSTFFQRMNTHPAQEAARKEALDTAMEQVNVLDLSKTFLAKYDLAKIKAILKMLLPFSDYTNTQTINGFLKHPDEMYMRYYIYNYFVALNKKDPDKAWREFSDRIKEVNKLYNDHGVPGYETDRGFIYLRYNAPSEVVTVENEAGALPYEIWQYNTLKQTNQKEITNAVFLFYKPNQMSGGYKLLHSTVAGELQTIAWRNYLYANAQGGNNANSRAEQYIGNR